MKTSGEGTVILKKGREASPARKHPWIFSGAVDRVRDIAVNGQTVRVLSADGKFLGYGACSAQSQIRVRIWSFREEETIDETFIRERLSKAVYKREKLVDTARYNAFRLVNSEPDGLPGLIVDKYDRYLVCQFLSAGAEYWKSAIVDFLQEQFPDAGIFERSDASSREKEGLELKKGLLAGHVPESLAEIRENETRFLVDIINGHKTGLYLDQRMNREILTGLSAGKTVLNCFSYTGGFGIKALQGNAVHVTNIDTSAECLAIAEKNAEINRLDPAKLENRCGDVFTVLRSYRDAGRTFGLIVLDPPKFAESSHQLEKAARGYKDINLMAFKLLEPGGILVTFSCSGHMVPELFRKVVADATLDAGRDVQVMQTLGQSPDHIETLNFPEGSYLKGLVCRAW